MGALHDGHRSLLARARRECGVVVMSLFVNPTQFNDPEDYARYPRDPERDRRIAADEGVDFVFEPSPDEMYPAGFDTTVSVGALANKLEGLSRPGHFQGVATVVAKLLLIAGCDRAYFGLKDYQQLQVVRRMVRDLAIPCEIVPCETLREPDGLAMSSRNVRLTPDERVAALVISRALTGAQSTVNRGERSAMVIRDAMQRTIASEPLARLDYAVIAHPDSLDEIETVDEGAVALVAATFGKVRLIDNRVLVESESKVLRARGAFKGMFGGTESILTDKQAEIKLEERDFS
jgi:pantoate--beta-alanine ligase